MIVESKSNMFTHILYNPSWKEVLELQRTVNYTTPYIGVVFVNGSISNLMDFSKLNNSNVVAVYGIDFKDIHKYIDLVEEEYHARTEVLFYNGSFV